MTILIESSPTFNLWREPWLTLEQPDGQMVRQSLEQTLLQAHHYATIYELSPLGVVSLHRLLTAILQEALKPQTPADLGRLWQAQQFPAAAIANFGQQYANRFDLFSADAPFMQSADLSLHPGKKDHLKTITYLTPELPAGTEITHYHHGSQDRHVFCSSCAAGGLVTIPAFATSGGSGIKPSINGVPPIYVLPTGRSLFDSLAASLMLPDYQPAVASKSNDLPWWRRSPLVKRSQEVYEVGYLHSLTFPARRVRLHPILMSSPCTRCGQFSQWGVQTMIFEMGESRSEETPFWFDPFAAYHLPDSKSKKEPVPIRPKAGQALWREFAGLFLLQPENAPDQKQRTLRPSLLDQMADLQIQRIGPDLPAYAFRCIGMRTDMKAKIFEWVDAEFKVPAALLDDPWAGILVEQAIQLATGCADVIKGVFRDVFRGASKKSERHQGLNTRMQDEYWTALANPFRQFVLALASPENQEAARREWLEMTIRAAKNAFSHAAIAVGTDAATLRQRFQGESRCDRILAKKRKEYLPDA